MQIYFPRRKSLFFLDNCVFPLHPNASVEKEFRFLLLLTYPFTLVLVRNQDNTELARVSHSCQNVLSEFSTQVSRKSWVLSSISNCSNFSPISWDSCFILTSSIRYHYKETKNMVTIDDYYTGVIFSTSSTACRQNQKHKNF